MKKQADSPFLTLLPDEFEFPMAHAEGRLVTMTAADAKKYRENGAAAVTYNEDVNGSFEQIAGLQDETGRVFGMMPHPERAVEPYHPTLDGVPVLKAFLEPILSAPAVEPVSQ